MLRSLVQVQRDVLLAHSPPVLHGPLGIPPFVLPVFHIPFKHVAGLNTLPLPPANLRAAHGAPSCCLLCRCACFLLALYLSRVYSCMLLPVSVQSCVVPPSLPLSLRVSAQAVAKAAVAAATDPSVSSGVLDVWAIKKYETGA